MNICDRSSRVRGLHLGGVARYGPEKGRVRAARAVDDTLLTGICEMDLRRVVAWCVVTGAIVPSLARCGGGQAAEEPPKVGAARQVVEVVEHEPCDTSGKNVEKFDARGDGKAVVIKVKDGSGHETCRVSDINRNGKPDLYEYFDDSGNLRRVEADYDSNGTIDAVEFYLDGKLVKREYDTTGQHRVDTWDYFDRATGKRMRRERDATNDASPAFALRSPRRRHLTRRHPLCD